MNGFKKKKIIQASMHFINGTEDQGITKLSELFLNYNDQFKIRSHDQFVYSLQIGLETHDGGE